MGLYATDVVTGDKRALACDCLDVGKGCADALLGGGGRVRAIKDGALFRTLQACLEDIRSGSALSWEKEYDSVELRTASAKPCLICLISVSALLVGGLALSSLWTGP